METITIHTDGSCIGNPGPGGWGAIVQHNGEETELSGPDNPTTNNRMEMMAVIRALQWVKEHDLADQPIQLHSDSSLVIKSLKDGWKRKANLDLWREMDTARDGLNVEWFWVKGHAGDPMNERCDRLAVAQSEKAAKLTPTSEGETHAQVEHPEGEYRCGSCGTVSDGNLGYMEEADMIRVDCPHCGRYIKFAAQTEDNISRAALRPLITKSQLAAITKQREGKGEEVSDREIKKLKGLTRDEAQTMLDSDQTLF
jgi:ribonuclease HI